MEKQNVEITLDRNLVIRTLTGAGIALAVILVFVTGGLSNPNPEWYPTWWVRPLLVTPIAGACGGLFFHFMYELGRGNNIKRIVLSFIAVIGFVIALWMGTVLGLVGTMWN
jgi:hypothetical protein